MSRRKLGKRREAEKKRRERFNKLSSLVPWRWIVAGSVVIALCVGVYFSMEQFWATLCQSSCFTLNKVVVKGNKVVSEEEVLRIAGFTPQMNMLAVKTAQLTEEIERHPWIERAVIYRQLPDTIVISLTERNPFAMFEGKENYLIDKKGIVFKKAVGTDGRGIPVIKGAVGMDTATGRLSGHVDAALEFLAFSNKGTRTLGIGSIMEIVVEQEGDFFVLTKEKGIKIHFAGIDVKKQFLRAEKVLWHLYRAGNTDSVRFIDMDYGNEFAVARLDA